MTPPTLADLRTTEATLRALAEAEPDDARGCMLSVVALDVRQRVRDAEEEQTLRAHQRVWATETRERLRKGH